MAGLSVTNTYDALLTTTLSNYHKKLYDNIFDVYPTLSYLNGKLGVALRGNTIKRLLDGGTSITEHLLYEKSSSVKSYAGAETFDMTLQEGMTIAQFAWKQYSAILGITGLEKRSNMGETALIRLLEAKTQQAEMTLKDMMSTDIFGDGTGNGSRVITGFANLVDNSATCGLINPSTYTWWKSVVSASAGSFAANGVSKMRTMYNSLSVGNDKPDFLVTDQNVYEYYEATAQPIERITNTKLADLGYQNLQYKSVPLVFDRTCTAGYMYMLNSKYINLCVHKDADMATQPFVTPNNQDVSSAAILWQGNLTTNNRRKLGVIRGITA